MALPVWQQVLYGVLTVLLMFGIGASLKPAVFWRVLARPQALGVGLASQFLVLPALGFGVASGLQLGPSDTLGLLLMVTVGGGNASNMLTYLVRGDLALSLSMTVTATIASAMLTPAWLFLLMNRGIAVPLNAIALTLAMMAVPVPLGMALRARSPELANGVDRTGRLAGLGLLVVILAAGAADVFASIQTAPAALFMACAGVSGGGLLLGSMAGWSLGFDRPQWLAIGLETGVQNLPAALAVLAVAFPAAEQGALQRAPQLYATIALLFGSLWAFAHRKI
ncbi:MAG: hypothetical protein AAGA48_02065 [Myxococcota bacterium]